MIGIIMSLYVNKEHTNLMQKTKPVSAKFQIVFSVHRFFNEMNETQEGACSRDD